MEEKDTKKRILDAAEQLFAQDGFHATSMRAITNRAEVNLAAVNYHFGSKEALMESVIERRLVPLNKVRIKRLEALRSKAEDSSKSPELREVLMAFVEPTLAYGKSGQGAKEFITLISRSIAEPDDTVRNIFLRHLKPLIHLLYETLKESLPDLPKDIVFWRLHFVIGAMSHAMQMVVRCHSVMEDAESHEKCGVIPDEMINKTDPEALTEMFLDFVTTGMKAPQ